MAAFEGKAVVRRRFSGGPCLNVCFARKRTLGHGQNPQSDRPLSANSGQSIGSSAAATADYDLMEFIDVLPISKSLAGSLLHWPHIGGVKFPKPSFQFPLRLRLFALGQKGAASDTRHLTTEYLLLACCYRRGIADSREQTVPW